MKTILSPNVSTMKPTVKQTTDRLLRTLVVHIVDDVVGFDRGAMSNTLEASIDLCIEYMRCILRWAMNNDLVIEDLEISSQTACQLYEFVLRYFGYDEAIATDQYLTIGGNETPGWYKPRVSQSGDWRDKLMGLPLVDVDEELFKVGNKREFYQSMTEVFNEVLDNPTEYIYITADHIRVWLYNIYRNDSTIMSTVDDVHDRVDKLFRECSGGRVSFTSNPHIQRRVMRVKYEDDLTFL